ncbi:MAG: ImmA/IrrE family metallo-endopeptidase [Candidatus Omnitrophota bacterium]
MKKLDIKFYDIPTLEQIAKTFTDTYHKTKTLEVDIDYIIEKCLGWTIEARGSLVENHCIEAFVTKNKVIYVDAYLMDCKERKYRFTLAEEVAHYTIHRIIYADCNNLEEHLNIYDRITANEYWRMDRNAKYLASAILMPAEIFEKRAFELYEKIDKKKYKTNEAVLCKITLDLSNDFNISDIASKIRFKNLGLHRKLITI